MEPDKQGTPYEGSSVLGAILLTIFAPFIALIAALLLRGSQEDPERKRQLSTWAVASGAMLLVGLFIVIALISSVSGPSTDPHKPCLGGPVMGATAEPIGNGRYRVACENGGSEILHFPD